jgi:hypothetical protein
MTVVAAADTGKKLGAASRCRAVGTAPLFVNEEFDEVAYVQRG